ncbi:MFS transporter (plasmid) [Leisingera aquaemixtae]|uniref:MFS transporter n=1 Tax=Leisingera aquaemixtae TaxID=1396826 RepID=A0ABY5WRH8_9RHOB|nr:MFS transporter [Leisingera aquaemixtae]UWQ43969.1 MFS transporter [Leisingera aquaemixtae]
MPGHEAQEAAGRRRFWRIAGAGAAFQGGSAAVDSATVVASLTHMLTGSALAVGYASAVLRLGWLLPQLPVGYLAERARRRMPFYVFGAFGRAAAAGAIALLLWRGADWPQVDWPPEPLAAGFLALWTVYSCISGVVAVPYNDIVGRAIPSSRRSRMLAWRFFGGGLLAIAAAGALRLALEVMPPLQAYAFMFALGSALMFLSSALFVSAGEPPSSPGRRPAARNAGTGDFLREGLVTFRKNRAFRLFLIFHWLGSATLMALPFYIVAARESGIGLAGVGTLLAAQTAGALVSNPLWGRIGDGMGKLPLLWCVTFLRLLAPALMLALLAAGAGIFGFAALYLVIGAMMNGVTISYLSFLMEISPDDRRPAYSAWFNTFAAPAALSPLLGAILASLIATPAVFAAAVTAAFAQFAVLKQLDRLAREAEP